MPTPWSTPGDSRPEPLQLFADCPRDLDVLFVPGFVPGGLGTPAAMADAATLAFLADRAATAPYVTSVCTGSLVLGPAFSPWFRYESRTGPTASAPRAPSAPGTAGA